MGKNRSGKNNPKRMYEEVNPEAKKAVWRAIKAKQSVPDWILVSFASDVKAKNEHTWILVISVFKKRALQEGVYWEVQSDGSKMLVHIDPKTLEKGYIIHYSVPDDDLIPIFEVEVDKVSHEVTFIKETVLAGLDPDDFEVHQHPDMDLVRQLFAQWLDGSGQT